MACWVQRVLMVSVLIATTTQHVALASLPTEKTTRSLALRQDDFYTKTFHGCLRYDNIQHKELGKWRETKESLLKWQFFLKMFPLLPPPMLWSYHQQSLTSWYSISISKKVSGFVQFSVTNVDYTQPDYKKRYFPNMELGTSREDQFYSRDVLKITVESRESGRRLTGWYSYRWDIRKPIDLLQIDYSRYIINQMPEAQHSVTSCYNRRGGYECQFFFSLGQWTERNDGSDRRGVHDYNFAHERELLITVIFTTIITLLTITLILFTVKKKKIYDMSDATCVDSTTASFSELERPSSQESLKIDSFKQARSESAYSKIPDVETINIYIKEIHLHSNLCQTQPSRQPVETYHRDMSDTTCVDSTTASFSELERPSSRESLKIDSFKQARSESAYSKLPDVETINNYKNEIQLSSNLCQTQQSRQSVETYHRASGDTTPMEETSVQSLTRMNELPYMPDTQQIAANIPPYLSGIFAMELGIKRTQWEYIISLKEAGSPRLKIAMKLNDLYRDLSKTDPARCNAVAALLDAKRNSTRNVHFAVKVARNMSVFCADWDWDAIIEMIEDDNWNEMTSIYKLLEFYDSNRDRVHYIKHMTRTFLDLLHDRMENFSTRVAAAAEATLPLHYRNNIKVILAINSHKCRTTDDEAEKSYIYEPPSGDVDSEPVSVDVYEVPVKQYPKEEAQYFFNILGSFPNQMCMVLVSLEQHLSKTNNPQFRDFSLFGKKGFEKYQALSKYICQEMNKKNRVWSPIGIAIIDSGCTDFLLKERGIIRGPYRNYINNVANILEDRNGHGSLVTEIIHRYCGFAYVKIYHYIVMGEDCRANPNHVIHALNEIKENADIDIVNMSLQSETYSSNYKNALDELGKTKVIISAAGNDLFGQIQCAYPALNAMTIPIDGIGIHISTKVSEPFVHLRCPSHSCDPTQQPATSYAAAHATALAAILLRYADILDKQGEENANTKAIDDTLLVRISCEWPWGDEIPVLQRKLGAFNGRVYLSNKDDFFEKLKLYVVEKNLSFYTLRHVTGVLLNLDEDGDILGVMKTTTEICWYISQHVQDVNTFRIRFIQKLKELIRIKYMRHTLDDFDWSHQPGRCPSLQLTMYRLLSHHTTATSVTPAQLLENLQLFLIREKYPEAARFLQYIIKGPCKRKLLTNKEHMQSMFINTNHDTLWKRYTSLSIESIVQNALNKYRVQIDKIAKCNYYPEDISKFGARFIQSSSVQRHENLNSQDNPHQHRQTNNATLQGRICYVPPQRRNVTKNTETSSECNVNM